MTEPLNLIEPVTDDDIDWVCQLMMLDRLDAPRRDFLKLLSTMDVSACPGSGKTTLIVAKLAILARRWKNSIRGICVLSHTNVAREEIEHRLGNTEVGQYLLKYPHFIGTIHGFINRYVATPWLLSAGYRVTAIDNDLTTRVRRRYLGERDFNTLSGFLERHHKSFDGLRITSSNFTTPLVNGSFPSGSDTRMYQLAESALRHAAEQGYFCHDEIFIFADSLLAQLTELPSILSQRFPFILIDEMQDTSEQQNNFLRLLFPRSSNSVCVQRVGDPNQAIFDGGSRPVIDVFPDNARCVGISNSFRFDASIATLATPFAYNPVQPAGLNGMRVTDIPDQGLPHTIFVFPDNDLSTVLDAFGRHVLASIPPALIGTSEIAAIGAVHKQHADIGPGHQHYPKTVAHYWAGYQSGANKQSYHPRTLAEYILAAQSSAQRSGSVHQCVNNVAFGITHLANLLAGATHLRVRSRQHLQIKHRLIGADTVKAVYRNVLTRFLIDREILTPELWTALCPSLKLLAATLGGGNIASTAADHFLAWPAVVVQPPPIEHEQLPTISPNIYRYRNGDASVDIRLCSIHLAKGETHLSTLILETYNKCHFLEKLLPWLNGDKQNNDGCNNDAATKRLLQAYVAMTRPTHLLCMAIRRGSLRVGDEEKLIAKGWRIEHLTPTVN
jgi:hypothetical protein